MRIGLFSDTYLPHANGVAVCVDTLKKGLENLGHDVYVITCNNNLKLVMEDNVLKLPSFLLKDFYNYSFTGPFHLKAINEIRKLKLDIIHIHTEFGVAILGRIIAKALGIPLVYTYHTMLEDYTHYINFMNIDLLDKPSVKLVEIISKMYCYPSNTVIVPSKKTYDVLMKYSIKNNDVRVLPSGIDLERFNNPNKENIEKLKKEYNLEDKKVMIYLGRVAKEKNIEILLETFKRRKDLILLVVGEGPELKYFKEKYNYENIMFCGKKEYTEVADYYSLADGFISASNSETQGLTFIEAMSTGKVLFCSDRVVLNDLLYENENGYFFDTSDELNDRIDEYYALSKEERLSMSNKSLEVSKRYDLKLFIEKIVEIYTKNLGKVYRVKKVKYTKNDTIKIQIRRRVYRISKELFEELNLKVNDKIDKNVLSTIIENKI
ncbi:glycosyltransferase [Streptobacillus felis]|uniref:Glycosyltransferase n=1 Tax=Streptobacillus felis TaxID=1384509 RepID=A0A7Z0PGS3_9FUSO|nr:glycosyltransferase [Streptobacillus felis]NYV28413.1 glycosyltransferase [Streptobacillus felis]